MFFSVFPSASVWLNTDMEMSYVPKDWFVVNITGNSEIFISVPDISKVRNITCINITGNAEIFISVPDIPKVRNIVL